MTSVKKNVLAIVFDNMTFMDFNGPHTAMNGYALFYVWYFLNENKKNKELKFKKRN